MKIALIVFLSTFVLTAFGQHESLSGSLPELAGKKLVVQYLDHFKAEIQVDAAGKFSADLPLEAGYYKLGGAELTIFLEPGMSLNVSKIKDKVVFAGIGSFENLLIEHIKLLAESYFILKNSNLTSKANFIEPVVFLAKLTQYKTAAIEILDNSTASKYFKNTQREYINYLGERLKFQYLSIYGIDSVKETEARALLTEYIMNSRLGHTDSILLAKYKRVLKESHVKTMSARDCVSIDVFKNLDMNNELAYRCSESYRFLCSQQHLNHINKVFAMDRSLTRPALLNRFINEYITNSFIKQEIEYQSVLDRFYLKRDVDKTFNEYVSTATNKDYINDIKTLYFGSKSLEGSQSPDFLFQDLNGKNISLSSMRGSYVYIDFWATYCIPCIGQLPALKLLEEKYKGKNIKFVGISEDSKKDLLKWQQFVADNKVGGIQLIAYDRDESQFHNFFKVSGIPRFILIDPNGKVISEEALYPDEPDLQKQINQLLAKN